MKIVNAVWNRLCVEGCTEHGSFWSNCILKGLWYLLLPLGKINSWKISSPEGRNCIWRQTSRNTYSKTNWWRQTDGREYRVSIKCLDSVIKHCWSRVSNSWPHEVSGSEAKRCKGLQILREADGMRHRKLSTKHSPNIFQEQTPGPIYSWHP